MKENENKAAWSIEFGFNPTDRMITLECKNCGYTKIKTGR